MASSDSIDPTSDLISESQRLRKEIARLHHLLRENGIDPFRQPSEPTNSASSPTEQTTTLWTNSRKTDAVSPASFALSTEQKVELFRSLFRGREDVYAVRWEGPHGRHGYSPASKRDWNAYNAAKLEDRKRVDKETRTYLPLTNQTIHDHLAGKQTIGVYPLLSDETCWFLAADFDKDTWQEDATAFLESCNALAVPAALERSRSGKGGHVWVFFDRPERKRARTLATHAILGFAKRAMLAPSSSHHHRCVFPFHPVPTLKTTTPVPLSILSPAKLTSSLAGNSLHSFLPSLSLARLRA